MAGENSQMFSMTMFTVIVFYPVIALTAGSLLVFDGPTDVTKRVLKDVKNDCLQRLDDSSLPRELRDSNSVSGPRSLNVTLNDALSQGYTGATFFWLPPAAGRDREGLKGFYVEINGERSGNRCRTYIFDNSGFIDMSLTFSLKMETFSRTTDNFIVSVYSMPPLEADKNNFEAEDFEFLYMTTKFDNTSLAEWSPTIAYKPSGDDGLVVIISLPPKQEGWLSMHFNLILMSCSDTSYNRTLPYSVNEDRTSTSNSWIFTGLHKKFFYSIAVEVVNYSRNSGICACGVDSSACGSSCVSTQTKGFSLLGLPNQPQTPVKCGFKSTLPENSSNTTKNPSTATPSSTEKPEITKTYNEEENSKTVPIIVVSVFVPLTLVIALVLAYIVIVRYRHKNAQDTEQLRENLHALHKRELDIIIPPVKELRRKTVYVVAAPDHPEAVHLIKIFCMFLQTHCQCDVINPCDVCLRQTCDKSWVASKMSSSDCVIIVNSREAGKLLDIYLSKSQSPLDHQQSLALEAVRFVFSSDDAKLHFLSVSFHQDWFKDKFAVLNPKKYRLHEQLPHFIRGLHNLSESAAEKYEGQLPLNMKCLSNLPEWQPFLKAMREEATFEKKHKLSPETKDVTSSPSIGLSKGPHSVSMEDLTLNPAIPEPAMGKSTSLETLTSSSIRRRVDENVPNIYELFDGRSYVTVGKVSDRMQNNVNKKPRQSAFIENELTLGSPSPPSTANDTSDWDAHNAGHLPTGKSEQTSLNKRNSRQKVSEPSPLLAVIPPPGNIEISNNDNVSNMISQMNDNLSEWSKHPGFGTIDNQNKIKGESERPSHASTTIIPPQSNLGLSNDDSVSDMISQLNDNLSEWSKHPGFGTIDNQNKIKGESERPSHSSPTIIPPRDNKDLSNDDSVSDMISQFNDNLSEWSKHPGFGTIDNQNKTRGESYS